MKLRAQIIAAEDNGDRLKITAQGQAHPARQWSPIRKIAVAVQISARNRRAFHVGRAITVTVEPE